MKRYIPVITGDLAAVPISMLLRFQTSRQGEMEIDVDWMLTRLLDRATACSRLTRCR